MRLYRSFITLFVSLIASLSTAPMRAPVVGMDNDTFTFVIAADIREFAGQGPYNTSQYFRGAVEAIAAHNRGSFILTPGDIDPPANIFWTITQTLGTSYIWYPVVGNHDAETLSDMVWLRAYEYGSVNSGPTGCPETTYSFDYSQTHFVILNEYCDVLGDATTDGDIPDHLYDWLVADLNATQMAHIFIIGHEPAYPQPDADNGRLRHALDSLNLHAVHRDRFWDLLKARGVMAYICGHTHNYSLVRIDGVWQLDVGHARGLGDPGARSTFSYIHTNGAVVTYETYRDDANGGPYTLRYAGILVGESTYLPLVLH